VLFGSGVKFFGDYTGALTRLEDPEVIRGKRVTHLIYSLNTAAVVRYVACGTSSA
jgi:hypothetical protein